MKAAFYKGTPKGVKGIYNRLVRWWTDSDFSHVELVFSDGVCASASFMDKGVRFKSINLDDGNWVVVDLTAQAKSEPAARNWFREHEGQGYDILGNIHFILSPVKDSKNKWFCSEAVAKALGFDAAGRYDPETLYQMLSFINRS